jgi:hypothetical protein
MPRKLLATPLLCAFVLSACSDNPVQLVTLTPQEVGGSYRICSLTFTPDGGFLPAVNIRTAVMETSPQDGLPEPYLRLSGTSTIYQLEYTPIGDFVRAGFEGSYETGAASVQLPFASAADAMHDLLLPSMLELHFSEGPRTLEISGFHGSHFVPRAHYSRLSGVDQTNLPNSIRGALQGHFQVGGCP